MKTIYLKTRQEVKVNDYLYINDIKVKLTTDFMSDNPQLFEIVNDIPEYWECVSNNGYNECWTIGKIYKLRDPSLYPKYLSLISNDNCSKNVLEYEEKYSYTNCTFKPSTKEAFDRQELLKEAKLKYPMGTVVRSFVSESSKGVISGEPCYWASNSIVCEWKSKSIKSYVCVYQNGNWAEILKPLYTTEDNVKLYDCDKYWWVETGKDEHYPYLSIVHNDDCVISSHNPFDDSTKVFSSRKAAEEYVNKHKEKTLENYEALLLKDETYAHEMNGATKWVYMWMKDNEPKLYYTKVLQLIADDLNDEFRNDIHYCVENINGNYDSDYYDNDSATGGIEFSSEAIADKAINIMGDKLDYIYEQNR